MMKPPSDAERSYEVGLLSVESLNCVLHGVDIFSVLKIHSFIGWPEFTHIVPEWD